MPNMNPYYTTYSTKRFSFVGNPEQRTGSTTNKDQRFVNCFAEGKKDLEGQKYYLEQRGGLVYRLSSLAGTGRGLYYWNNSVFSVVGSVLYRNGTALQTLSTSTGSIGFVECAKDTARFLVVLDGTSGWVINTAFTVTKITSANFPSPHVVQAGYIDGYLVVAKAGTADLYNSNLEEATLWTAGDFITAETFPDTVVAVCRQNNYIVAIGQQTTEYFYDAGTSPGTPLARNSAALHQIGTPAPDTLAQMEEQIIFVGQTATGGRTVWVFSGFNPNEVGTETIRQSLDNEGANISNAKAFTIRSKGHKFYVLNLTSTTWVFDFDSQMWHEWADYTGASKFGCDYACDYFTGAPLMLDRANGCVYEMKENVATDATSSSATSNITTIAITDKHDFGTMNQKFMHRLALVCDVPMNASCTIYWSDDDYQTWSTGRVVEISSTMPSATQFGMFRRRAFKLVYSQPYPIRLEGFEVDINVGTQ